VAPSPQGEGFAFVRFGTIQKGDRQVSFILLYISAQWQPQVVHPQPQFPRLLEQ